MKKIAEDSFPASLEAIKIQYYKSKIGELILGSFNNKLCLLDFKYRKMRLIVDNRIKNKLSAKFLIQDNKILKDTRKQIGEYLSADRKEFDLPILTVGTDFQKEVWNALSKIKYGETASYLDLAKNIGNQKAVQAIASANAANSLALIIPCHRIIGSNRDLIGYGGGLAIKKRLLNLEKNNLKLNDNEKYNFIGQKNKKFDYKFITAVTTTGIFCLPSCRAKKPNRENVIFFDINKEAIMNGFRACKICKP